MLGCADIAWRRTLPAFAASGEVAITAVASRDPLRGRRFADRFGAVAAPGYAAVLGRDDVDAVYLPLPPAIRAQWVQRALDAGKHVLAEKPLTTSAEQTAALAKDARARDLVLWENFAFLHHGCHAEVRALLDGGAIGEIRHLTGVFTIPPRPDGDIRYRPELGGGALLDAGVYPLRVALDLLGSMTIAGAVSRVDRRHGVDVAGSALATTADGTTAALSFGMDHAYRCAYEIVGSRGRLIVERVFTMPPGHRPVLRIERQDRAEEITLSAEDQVINMIRAFAHATADPESAWPHTEASVAQARLVEEIATKAIRFEGG